MTRQQTPNIMDEILAAKPAPKPTYVKTTSIRRDGGMQPRASLNLEYVKDLMAAIEEGAKLPPVDVTYDGEVYWLWDGYHRWQAHNDLGLLDIAAVIHQGDQVSAQWSSFGTNQAHGLRRSNEDKERAARAALKHPLAAALSNREIARHLGIDEKTVRKYREDMTATAEIPQSTNRTGADGRTINTANIGAKAQPAQEQSYMKVWQIEQSVVQGIANSPAQLRAAATGARIDIWGACKELLDRVGLPYRSKDLVQALNNVASQREQRERYNRAPEEKSEAATPAAAEPDPWRVAYDAPGSRQATVERLARALMPWLREYRDAYDRGWHDIAERGNVAHTNSTLWSDIQKEQRRRGLQMSEGILKDAIKQAFHWLAADRKLAAAQTLTITEAASAVADAEAALAQPLPAIIVDGYRPLPEWAAEEPELESAAQIITQIIAPDANPTQSALIAPVSQREDYDGDEWYTPAEYIEAARQVMGSIDLDPASSDLAQTVVQAECHLTKAENGLGMVRWLAQTIWLNPPYSNPALWVDKLVSEFQAGPFVHHAIILVNNATETAWFQTLLQRYPVCLPAKRLAFWRHDQSGLTARQGQAFFYLGPDVDKFVAVFSQFGPVLRRLS